MTRASALILLLCLCAAPVWAQDGQGSEDDPYLLDLDELLKAGNAVIITPEDTVVMSETRVDTIRVTAPRLRVSEVVRRIGETMRQRELALESYVSTQVDRVVMYDSDDDRSETADRNVYVTARRISRDPRGEMRNVRLYSREEEYRDGELKKSETEADIEQEWQEEIAENTMAMPFDLLTSGRFKYEIKERTLIGENLVFRIAFEPANVFETSMAGEVWIDYSDFVIRRMEGRIVGPSPMPLLVKAIPRFVLRFKQYGDYWTIGEFQGEIDLNGSVPRIPDYMVINGMMRDVEINGVSFGEGGAP
jgi:hypothetical protein